MKHNSYEHTDSRVRFNAVIFIRPTDCLKSTIYEINQEG